MVFCDYIYTIIKTIININTLTMANNNAQIIEAFNSILSNGKESDIEKLQIAISEITAKIEKRESKASKKLSKRIKKAVENPHLWLPEDDDIMNTWQEMIETDNYTEQQMVDFLYEHAFTTELTNIFEVPEEHFQKLFVEFIESCDIHGSEQYYNNTL